MMPSSSFCIRGSIVWRANKSSPQFHNSVAHDSSEESLQHNQYRGDYSMTSQEAGTPVDKAMRKTCALLPTAISAMALIGSVLSMWQTTIKQAEASFHLSNNTNSTRDLKGIYKVLILPVTLANPGAPAGTSPTLSLPVKNLRPIRARDS